MSPTSSPSPNTSSTPASSNPANPSHPNTPRAGHILSNIRLNRIPPEARVHIIQHRAWLPQAHVQEEWRTLTSFGRVPHKMRGWTLDVYNQITQLPTEFSLQEAYTSAEQLARLHPENKHIKPKIRQHSKSYATSDSLISRAEVYTSSSCELIKLNSQKAELRRVITQPISHFVRLEEKRVFSKKS